MTFKIDVHHYFHHPGETELPAKLDNIALSITSLRGYIMSKDTELQATLTDVKATLVKVGGEIDAFKTSAAADTAALQTAIAALEAELANATGGPSDTTVVLTQEIKDLALALDGKIDDLPATPA